MRSCSHAVVLRTTGDGQRFLVNTQAKEAENEPMTVILDWTAKLNK